MELKFYGVPSVLIQPKPKPSTEQIESAIEWLRRERPEYIPLVRFFNDRSFNDTRVFFQNLEKEVNGKH